MTERLERARRLGERIDAGWQREDVEAQLARLHVRQRVRARRRVLAVPLAIAIAATIGVWWTRGSTVAPHEVARVAPLPVAPAPVVAPVPTPEPPAPAAAAAAPDEGSAVPPPSKDNRIVAHHASETDAPIAAPVPSWRDDANRGAYAAAWLGLVRAAPLDRMEDLLLAGDVARLSGHPDAAVAQLARAVERHPDDPRAPLAAFTLGRVHLEDLGSPRDAAQAFAHARALAPSGPLAEDALAREVEAWSRAGETETARARAVTYGERYPKGRRAHAVRRFGGLEVP